MQFQLFLLIVFGSSSWLASLVGVGVGVGVGRWVRATSYPECRDIMNLISGSPKVYTWKKPRRILRTLFYFYSMRTQQMQDFNLAIFDVVEPIQQVRHTFQMYTLNVQNSMSKAWHWALANQDCSVHSNSDVLQFGNKEACSKSIYVTLVVPPRLNWLPLTTPLKLFHNGLVNVKFLQSWH